MNGGPREHAGAARTTSGSASAASLVCTINGRRLRLRAHPLKRLLDVLREDCGLTGTKEGCGEGECGACTVLLDGAPVNACLVPFAHADGARVTTIEGLGGRHPLQRAFVEHNGAQCGICTPGMIMAAVAVGKNPTLDDIRVGLAGNLCRCTGYSAIYRSVLDSRRARNRRERGERRDQIFRTNSEDKKRPKKIRVKKR